MSTQIITIMIVCLVGLAIFFLFGKSVKMVSRFLLSAAVGAVLITAANFVLTPINLSVGINAITILIAGVLGPPGVLMLYVSSYFL